MKQGDTVLSAMVEAQARELYRQRAKAIVHPHPWPDWDGAGDRAREIMRQEAAVALPNVLAAAEALGWRLVPADEHKRLKERVAQLDEPYVDDRGEHWIAPTAYAYAAVCKALRTCKAELGAARARAEAAAPKVSP